MQVTGCENTSENSIQILPQPDFTVDTTQACELGLFTFTNLTPGEYTSVTWSFGDGSVSYEPIFANHSFVGSGCYDVTLTLESSNGCITSLTQEDMVCVLPNPIANFIIPDNFQNYQDNMFFFENLSENAQTYNLTFGDGNTWNAINPIYSYSSSPGIYPISLIAVNEYGCADTTYG